MVFSDTTNKSGAIQYCEMYTQLGDAGISGNSTLLKYFTSLINIANSQIWHKIFSINGGWKYDDSNYTDLPQATQNLQSGVQLYALPSAALAVDRVEVMDASGAYQLVKPIRLDEISQGVNTFMSTNGLPLYYRLIGNTIQLFPAPDNSLSETLTSGLKVYFQRASVSFTSNSTTQTFGFASEYHDIPPRRAVIEWYKVNKPDNPAMVELVKDDVARTDELMEYETNKWHNVKPSLQARRFNYR